jgi:hypothetical protein
VADNIAGRETSNRELQPVIVPPKDAFIDLDHVPALLIEMRREFDKSVAKGKDFVSTKQLGLALEKPNVTGGDAAVAAALYKINRDLQTGELSLDPPKNPLGLTSDQLTAFTDKALTAPKACLTNANESSVNVGVPDLWAGVQFVLAHKPESGRIMLSDIDKSLATTIGDTATKQSLNFFKEHYSEICKDASHSEDTGVSFADAENFARKYTTTCAPLWDMRNILYNHKTVVTEGVPTKLYSTADDPTASINHKGIEQSLGEDCYFESPFGSFADKHKDTILHMIKDNENGTFTVNFPNTAAKYTVSKPTEAERIIYNKGGTQGDWATVTEKAFGLWFNDKTKKGAVQASWEVPEEYASHPDLKTMSIELLSGGKTAKLTELDSMTEGQLQQSLTRDFTDNKAVAIGRARSNFERDELVDLAMGHDYEVVAYDPKGTDGGTVTVRNPWDGPDNTYSGQFEISLDQLKKSFYQIAEEQ